MPGHGGAGPRGCQPRLGLAGAGGRRGRGLQQDEVTRGLQLQLQTFQQQAVAKFLGRYIFSIYLLCIGNYYLMIMSDCKGVNIVQVTFLDKLGHEKGEKRGRYYGGTNYNDAVFRGLG